MTQMQFRQRKRYMRMEATDRATEERLREREVPAEPFEASQLTTATRTHAKFLGCLDLAEELLKNQLSFQISVNGRDVWSIGSKPRLAIYGMLLTAAMENLTYWEHHAKRFVKIPKHEAKRAEVVRLQVDQFFNS